MVLIKTIIPINSVQYLRISLNQPSSLFHNHLDVRVALACFSPFPGIALLLPVLKNLWISGFRRRATQSPLSIRANAMQPSSPSLFSWAVNYSLIQKLIRMKVLQVLLSLIKPFSGVAQASAKTCPHCISTINLQCQKAFCICFCQMKFIFWHTQFFHFIRGIHNIPFL